MEHYVGIDLGTTNSAICTYDGSQTRIWKSPEQNDVTPSAIYIDRRGNKYIGQRAYDAASRSPDNCATLFKRFMGTSTPIELPSTKFTFTPEECSAEILKTLFGYLPEEIRNSSDIATVITVPAAFNQIQKDATMKAAEMAGIGKVALMQEPVAAVMSAMKGRSTDGIFLIYDFGGGTLDIAIAESIRGKVTLLAQGGIQMCGGRDFDRLLVDNLVRPWLHENFELFDDLSTNSTYKPLLRMATWATERAKIELNTKDEAIISLSEIEVGMKDLKGNEIYLEIPLQREFYNDLIVDRINDTICAARDTLSETGLTPNDLESIIWVGGPTHYKPLRDQVSSELGIDGHLPEPYYSVAEGASIFAESIFAVSVDRSHQSQSRTESKVKDLLNRRNQIFETYTGMDLLQNSFYNLNATQRDNRHRIMELAEKQSLLLDANKCMEARSELTNPRKRISAEVAWLPGVSPERVYDILLLLESAVGNRLGCDTITPIAPIDSLATALVRVPYAKKSIIADEVLETLKLSKGDFREVGEFLGIHTLTPIARSNLLAARMLRLPDYTSNVVAEWILAIVQTFENINPPEVQAILNVEREASSFPEITELSDITSEIQKCRRYYQQVIKFALDNIHSAKERSKTVMTVVEFATDNDANHWSILVEDTVDVYEKGAEAFLETEVKNIKTQDKKIRIAAR